MASEIYIKIEGWVQGVNFRHESTKRAKALSLSGFVRNTDDGAVEIVAQGDRENLEKLLAWARQGPPAAEVDKVDIEWRTPKQSFSTFEIKY